MRLFIAIDFNELGDYFIGLQKLLPLNARLAYTRTFHLTLKFLGEVQPEKVNSIIGALKTIGFETFSVTLCSLGIFPTENHIRVVWVGLMPEEKVLELQKKIDESLKGMFKSDRGFKAHITLARVKSVDDKKAFVGHLKKIKVERKRVEIRNFRLIRSTLTPNGAVYEDMWVS